MNSTYGIIILPLVPVRLESSEQSEMVTQLLYGEKVKILNKLTKWLLIENEADSYRGWVDRKMVKLNSNNIAESEKIITIPNAECTEISTGYKVFLPGASIVRMNADNTFLISESYYSISDAAFTLPNLSTTNTIVHLAKSFMNAPYLWGGKTIMGIDCAALVQVVFRMMGIKLPRDTYDQVLLGTTVENIENAQEGDIAFFSNDKNKAVHVGIISDNGLIIHASGWVKEEKIDNTGIISAVTGLHSHRLCAIKRML